MKGIANYVILSVNLTAVLRSALHDGKAAHCMTEGPHVQYPPKRSEYSVDAAILVHGTLGCTCTPTVTQLSLNREIGDIEDEKYFVLSSNL